MALKEYLGATGLTDILTKLKTWVLGEVSGLMDKATYTDANDRIPLTKGGTGASSASGARTNLGLGSAATKSSTTSVTSGGTGLPTSGAVYSAINTAKNDRMAKDGSNADSMVTFSNLTVGSNYSRTSGNNCIMAGEDISASGEYSLAQGSGIGVSTTVSCELNDTLNIGDSIISISVPDAYIGYPCYIPYLDRYGYSVYAHLGSSSEIVLSESSGKSYPDGDPLDVQFYVTTSATAYCSQAFGYNSSAGGKYAHAEGDHCRAVREAAHAEGKETISSGEAAHSEGQNTQATHSCSHAEGFHTQTGRANQHVQGSYNVGRSNTLFEIGNGVSNSLKNAFEVYTDGSLSTDNGVTKVKLQDLPSKNGGDAYDFYIANTAASTAVAWCNKVVKFSATRNAEAGSEFKFSVTIAIADGVQSITTPDLVITSVTLYDAATAKQTIASTNFTYTGRAIYLGSIAAIQFDFTVAAAFITSTIATALNAVIASKSPGFACVYAANALDLHGTIIGKRGIVEQIPGFASAFNAFPSADHVTQHVGDFYLPTGGPRWNLEIEVDPGTAYYAVCYLVNTTTGAYFNHSICYVGVPVPTIAAPTVAPAPVAGKVIAFVGTTWTPFAAGVAGVVDSEGVVTTKPRLRIVGYHANNAPTAGLGMHIRLFRIY